MRRVCLTVIGMCLTIVHAFSQTKDTSAYKSRPLRLDEVNIVSSYYTQTADKSAVSGGQTGAIGNGDVTDLANGIEIKFVGWDGKGRKNNLTGGLGLDHHTAASQGYVDLNGTAKKDGSRLYPTLDWSIENTKKGTEFGIGAYYSAEHHYYHSIGLNTSWSKKNKHNGEFSAKLSGFFDNIRMIYPAELIPVDSATVTTPGDSTVYVTTASGRTEALTYSTSGTVTTVVASAPISSKTRDSYAASFGWTQVINTRMQMAFLMDLAYQNGYLGLPFHRVYFKDSATAVVEHLPSNRFKLPLGVRLNYFLGDNVILRAYYRFYVDSWGLTSHTASLEVPVKITPFFSVSPFYRYYVQTAARYFAPYQQHTAEDTYYTSNYALSAFSANFFGVGVRIAPPKGIFFKGFNTLEIRYGHYAETTDLTSDVVSVALKFR
ncbi:DUF3570 domain-containing protein [Dinghuibacter silviterrae]|uniref:Uncharacterized protein DUF3570 n=1 Tax=Dinghuibacter silviterrae TaxID=1539049 RepID=A0A4R8DTS9_9BACT|nr:DUF3570 domain-containing protein [Dinghuibacter silviterrae]TDX01724.1 uncharacterized protein DUF3570 [Dinghuibacter silviterrae]